MESLEEITYSYGIEPRGIRQITPSVYRLEDGENSYALKKSSLTKEFVSDWERVFHDAYHYNLPAILPVYLTKDQSLFKKMNDSIFYVTPWIHEQSEKNMDQLYQTIGTIHQETKNYKSVNKDSFIEKFTSYQTYCGKKKERLLSTIVQFEAQHFMSPFELQVCTHFRDIELALHILQTRIEQLVTEQEQEENNEWSFSLCHGQLTQGHFLVSHGNYYLINWEKSSYNYPIMDLIYLFKQTTQEYHAPKDKMIKDFTVYMKKNKLTKSELYLMLIYLLDPVPYFALLEKYIQQQNNMIEITKLLQKQYRIICFAIEFSYFIENEYEQLSKESIDDQSHSK